MFRMLCTAALFAIAFTATAAGAVVATAATVLDDHGLRTRRDCHGLVSRLRDRRRGYRLRDVARLIDSGDVRFRRRANRRRVRMHRPVAGALFDDLGRGWRTLRLVLQGK